MASDRSTTNNLRHPSSGNSLKNDSGDTRKSEKAINPNPVPWSVYYFAFFSFSLITSLVSINLPVFLHQGLNLDWTTTTLLFLIPIIPALARPLIVRNVDRETSIITSLVNFGVVFSLIGCGGILLSFWAGPASLVCIIIGLTSTVVGVNLFNVAADSHILRVTPLELSARVNTNRKVATFLGVLTCQVFYIGLVNIDFHNLVAWNQYFLVSLLAVMGSYFICVGINRSWCLLAVDSVTLEFKILKKWARTGKTSPKVPWVQISLLLAISYCFALPDGLNEVTFENFIIDTYAENGWVIYSSFLIFSGAIMVVGYLIARRVKKTIPEKWLLLVVPFNLAYYAIFYFVPSVSIVIVLTIILFIFNGFMQVILFQFWQKNAFWWRPALLFQLFFFGYQIGKLLGILLSGAIMIRAGYPGIFLLSAIFWGIALICNVIFVVWSNVKKRNEQNEQESREDSRL